MKKTETTVVTMGETEPVSFTANGKHFTATFDAWGNWSVPGQYKGERLSARHITGLVAQVERIDAEEAAKAARAKALREAAKNPHPAFMLSRGRLVQIGVRGTDARRRAIALIIDEDGEKTSVDFGRVLRVLTDEDQATIMAALQASREAGDRTQALKGIEFSKVAEGLEPVTLQARWDNEAQDVAVDYDSVTFHARTTSSLASQVQRHRVAALYPWTTTYRDGVVPTTQGNGSYDPVFSTEVEAQAYLDALEHSSEQSNAVQRMLLRDYRFDFSVFTDDKEEDEETDES